MIPHGGIIADPPKGNEVIFPPHAKILSQHQAGIIIKHRYFGFDDFSHRLKVFHLSGL